MPPADLLSPQAIPLIAARRLNYFHGRLLTAEDLQAEQDYHLGRRRLHNRLLHGAGVVTGLAVSVAGGSVHVSAGLALDCLGREIVVPAPAALRLPPKLTRAYLLLRYSELGAGPLPLPPDPSPFAVDVTFGLIEESFVLEWGAAPERHRRFGAGWRSCGADHGLPLARLLRARGRWREDPAYRRPSLA